VVSLMRCWAPLPMVQMLRYQKAGGHPKQTLHISAINTPSQQDLLTIYSTWYSLMVPRSSMSSLTSCTASTTTHRILTAMQLSESLLGRTHRLSRLRWWRGSSLGTHTLHLAMTMVIQKYSKMYLTPLSPDPCLYL